VTGIQYFVPVGKQNVLTLTVTVGAVINFLLNIVLIKLYSSLGACIASVIAELCVTVVGFIYIKKKKCFELTPIFKSSVKYFIAGIIMFACLLVIQIFVSVSIFSLVILIVAGVAIYFVMLLILRDKLLLEILYKGIEMIKNIFHKKND
jgi:O-antigen/teichoic acid export membrane protein